MSIYSTIFQVIVALYLIVFAISTVEFIIYSLFGNIEAIKKMRENGEIGQNKAAIAMIGTGLYCIIDLLIKIEQNQLKQS